MNNNVLAEIICRDNLDKKPSYLDSKNILWKVFGDTWKGRRAIQTKDLSIKWLCEVNDIDIKKYLCGEEADYQEEFFRV